MGDMADDFRALKQFHKERREKRAEVNIEQLKVLGIPAQEQSRNVFRIDTIHGAVMFYPPSGKWQHRGRVMKGTLEQFRDWLKKNHYLQ